jgi:DNA adenine methylase
MLLSRKWFNDLQQTPTSALTDIQRAARYFYLQKASFGGLVRTKAYAIFVTGHRFTPKQIPDLIERAHQRLLKVQIEEGPYQDILKRYDRPTTFFYVDPPYYGIKLYRHNMDKAGFEELAERLAGIKGKFLLSLNDVPDVREIFSCFKIDTIGFSYGIQMKGQRRHEELLIRNY